MQMRRAIRRWITGDADRSVRLHAREKAANAFLADVHLRHVKFGTNSVDADDVLTFSGTNTILEPASAGQVGFSVVGGANTDRIKVYDSGTGLAAAGVRDVSYVEDLDALALPDLSDTTITSADTYQGLYWNTSTWQNKFKRSLAGLTAPTATDDSTANYELGSEWFASIRGVLYGCWDATASSAIWEVVGNNATTFVVSKQRGAKYGTIQSAIDAAETALAAATIFRALIEVGPGSWTEDITITYGGVNLVASDSGFVNSVSNPPDHTTTINGALLLDIDSGTDLHVMIRGIHFTEDAADATSTATIRGANKPLVLFDNCKISREGASTGDAIDMSNTDGSGTKLYMRDTTVVCGVSNTGKVLRNGGSSSTGGSVVMSHCNLTHNGGGSTQVFANWQHGVDIYAEDSTFVSSGADCFAMSQVSVAGTEFLPDLKNCNIEGPVGVTYFDTTGGFTHDGRGVGTTWNCSTGPMTFVASTIVEWSYSNESFYTGSVTTFPGSVTRTSLELGASVSVALDDLTDVNAGSPTRGDFMVYKGLVSPSSDYVLTALWTPYIVGKDPNSPYTVIQNAVNACVAAGGGTILIGPGTYTEDLVINSSGVEITLIGIGVTGAKDHDVDSGDVIIVSSSGSTGVLPLDYTITTTADSALRVRNITFKYTGTIVDNACVEINGNSTTGKHFVHFKSCRILKINASGNGNQQGALKIINVPASTDLECVFEDCYIFIDPSSATTFFSSQIYTVYISTTGVFPATFIGCDIRQSTTNASWQNTNGGNITIVHSGSGGVDLTVRDCDITNSSTNTVYAPNGIQRSGAHVFGFLVVENSRFDVHGNGILYGLSSTNAEPHRILGNYFSYSRSTLNGRYGVQMNGASTATNQLDAHRNTFEPHDAGSTNAMILGQTINVNHAYNSYLGGAATGTGNNQIRTTGSATFFLDDEPTPTA
jgi:hypothetical protein